MGSKLTIKTICKYIGIVLCVSILVQCKPSDENNSSAQNILLIVADDLGYTDLGCYGSEIRTPHIDALASRGLRNTSFCTAPTCSPSRAMLLTGTTAHLSGLGTMAGDWADNQKGKNGYEGHLNFDVVTFPRILQYKGYHTSITGKWHLALPPTEKTRWPINRGFDKSFCLMQGGGGHFYDKQPLLSFIDESLYAEDSILVGELPKDFYSSTYYVNKTIDYIEESLTKQKPFFHLLSFTAPHWPLQVPDKYLNLYKGVYDEGYEELAKSRLRSAKAKGVIPENTVLPPLLPNVKSWKNLSEEEQKEASRNMEIYAAMIEVMDMEVGRLIADLKQKGIVDNTIIIFISDNGAEGNTIMTYEGTGDWVEATFDNSPQNQGKINSYLQLDAGWAQAASLPFKWYKAFSYEGGVRVPAIFSFPQSTQKAGFIHKAYLSIMDLAPTFLKVADIPQPTGTYEGRQVHPMKGQSMLGWITGKTDRVHNPATAHCWELFGRIGVRQGDWKAVKLETPYGTGDWELYNLKEDISEENNLAASQPEVLKMMIAHWHSYEKENQVVLPDRPTAYAKELYWKENDSVNQK